MGLRLCIFSKLLGDLYTAGPWTTLESRKLADFCPEMVSLLLPKELK